MVECRTELKLVTKKIKELTKDLTDKYEEIEGLIDLNNTLIVKERESNDELQDIRTTLIKVSYLIDRPLSNILFCCAASN